MTTEVHRVDDVAIWMDAGGGITMRATTPSGDPVELSSRQARRIAEILLQLADQDDE